METCDVESDDYFIEKRKKKQKIITESVSDLLDNDA